MIPFFLDLILYYWLVFLFQGAAVAVGLFLIWYFDLASGGIPDAGGFDTLDQQKKNLKKWRS